MYLELLKTVLKTEGLRCLERDSKLLNDFNSAVDMLRGDTNEIKYSQALEGCSSKYARDIPFFRENIVCSKEQSFLLEATLHRILYVRTTLDF